MSRDLSTARPVGRRNLDPAGAIIGSSLPNGLRLSGRVFSAVRSNRLLASPGFVEIPLDYEERIEWQLLVESCLEKKALTRSDPISAATFKLYK